MMQAGLESLQKKITYILPQQHQDPTEPEQMVHLPRYVMQSIHFSENSSLYIDDGIFLLLATRQKAEQTAQTFP